MPIQALPTTTGGPTYGDPFVGPANHTAPVSVTLSGLTNAEIDAYGWLPPGLPITRGAALVAAQTKSVPGAGAVGVGNANGVVSAVVGGWGAPAETITVTMTGTGATAAFRVEGSVSGLIGTGAVGTAFDSAIIGFSIADGSTDWEAADTYVFTVTAGVSSRMFGCVAAATKVAADNASGTIAALGVQTIILVTIGQVNRDILEDNLARVLTDDEVASFQDSSVVLI